MFDFWLLLLLTRFTAGVAIFLFAVLGFFVGLDLVVEVGVVVALVEETTERVLVEFRLGLEVVARLFVASVMRYSDL